eukprot:TRINITY_DN570_c0_g2_i1.p1 TRINITY_DN570_c0_g2~~TRINITY_DN570_c0_g2_i1.p1  ORF type:complete len:932 (-),score=224.09 TRINITY_DN570_c0_g2_i1:50-2437(-)
MAGVQQLNNSADEIKKLKETNRKLKLEADDLRSRLQRAEKINASSINSAQSHHLVSSSDDEAGYHHLNSSFNSIKSEDGTEPAAAKATLDDEDDLLALLDDVLPTAPAVPPASATSSFKEPEPEKKKTRAKKVAAPKAKSAASKKASAAASVAPVPSVIQPCNHESEIQVLKEENAKLKAEIAELNERVEALHADLSVAREESRSSQDQLISLRQRLADMLGLPFAAPAPIAASAPVPTPVARPIPAVAAPKVAPLPMFGIPDDDDDDNQMNVDVAPTAATGASSSSSQTSAPIVSASTKTPTPPPKLPAATVAPLPPPAVPSAPVPTQRTAVTDVEPEAKKTKKRATPSETPAQAAASPSEARPAKKPKLAEYPTAASPKVTAAPPRPTTKISVVSEPKAPANDQTKLQTEIESAIRTFPENLASAPAADLFVALLKPEASTKCFTDKVLHHIIALLRQELNMESVISALFAAISVQEKDTPMDTIYELDLDKGRLVEQRVAAALDSMIGESAAPNFLDSFADALLSSPRTTIFYVMSCRIFVAFAKRTNQLQRAQALVTDLISHINSLSSCIAAVCACYNEWKSVFAHPGSTTDSVLDTIKFILLRCSQDIKKSHTGIYNLFQRFKSDLGWSAQERSDEQSLPDFKSCFSEPIQNYVATFSDSLIIARGGYPAPLQNQLNRALKCIEMLCVRMPESWIRSKIFNWILTLLSEETTTRDIQARALLAAGPVLSSLLESSKDPKLLEQMLHLLPAILSAPTFSQGHRAAAARVAEYLFSNAPSVAARSKLGVDAS